MRYSILAVLLGISAIAAQHSLIAEETYSYAGNIKSVIDGRCLDCHQSWASSYQSIMAATNLVIPGDPDNSRIIWRIEGVNASGGSLSRMPYGGPYLSDETIAMFRAWITQGAVEEIPTGIDDSIHWRDVKQLYE